MGMGTRPWQEKQEDIWIANAELARSPGHPFYQRLNELLDGEKFDAFVEGLCRKFYAAKHGPPGSCAGDLLPLAADRIFRGHRQRARDRLAAGGFAWRCGSLWALG